MLAQGLELTLIGMTSVFLFLLLLIALMYAQAAVFKCLGICDAVENNHGGEDDSLVAAAIAVKLKNS